MSRHPSVFVHGHALCESHDVGPHTRVWAFAHVMAGARVGARCNIGEHVFIEDGAEVGNHVTIKNGVQIWDGVTVEDDVFIGPNATFTNDRNPRSAFKTLADEPVPVRIRRGATIGANATVLCGLTIGEDAFVGAGSVVVGDVAANALVVGNPARRVGWVCACGRTLDPRLRCGCGHRYRLLGDRVGLAPAS